MAGEEPLLAELASAAEAFASFIEALSPQAFHRRSGPETWTIAEITGHVSEFPLTFAAAAARIAAEPGIAVGRAQDDEGRLAALERVGGRTPAEAAAFVRQTGDEALALLRPLAGADWNAAGKRANDGEPMTVRAIVGVIIVQHLGDHLRQAREQLTNRA